MTKKLIILGLIVVGIIVLYRLATRKKRILIKEIQKKYSGYSARFLNKFTTEQLEELLETGNITEEI